MADKKNPNPSPESDAWYAEEGDYIEGVMTKLDRGTSEYGAYPIVWLRVTGGTMRSGQELSKGAQYAVHAFRQVLRSQFAKWRPVSGETVRISLVSVPEGRGIGNYFNYRMEVEGREVTSQDWDNLFGRPQPIEVPGQTTILPDEEPPF